MHKLLNTIDELYQELEEDKNWSSANSGVRNRYPQRFVLFETFYDYFKFVQKCSDNGILVVHINAWMIEENDDYLLTYSQLANQFRIFISNLKTDKDYLIAPFSEISRFYGDKEFHSLLTTIRLIEAKEEAQNNHQRIYVPIIGLQNKIIKFFNDPNIFIWEYSPDGEQGTRNYQLILTEGTLYNVKNFGKKYAVCHNVKEWISLWSRNDGNVPDNIICSSKAVYYNADNARPDNAFNYTICQNAFEFLHKGLGIDFGGVIPKENEMSFWEQVASDVDVEAFNFFEYVKGKFNVRSINSVEQFIIIWINYKDNFLRWLLKTYYLVIHSEDSYLKRVLLKCNSQSSDDLFNLLATQIFEEQYNESAISQRATALSIGAKSGLNLNENAEQMISAKLKAMAADPARGCYTAMKYMSSISQSEKNLMIQWLGMGKIDRNAIKTLYPELYAYTTPFNIKLNNNEFWINSYFTEYCKSKVANKITDELDKILKEKNASSVSFEKWHDEFSTVKTVMNGREDIEEYYWIDGLGVDWFPFIRSIIEQNKVDNVYLNEIHIATAELPTITSINKLKLQELCGEKLEKTGDIDSFAHSQKKYPDYLDKEFSLVKKAISTVLSKYNGKKIAIVSDHGISYLANQVKGLSLVGIKQDHAGRCGEWIEGKPTKDSNYYILEDGKTICSLNHHSLTSKVAEGQGAHGGATPEEVLVPIIIVSNKEEASNIIARLLETEISASSPILKYEIKGLNSIDIPIIQYNGKEYALINKGDNQFESEKLELNPNVKDVTLVVGKFKQQDELDIKSEAEENNILSQLI